MFNNQRQPCVPQFSVDLLLFHPIRCLPCLISPALCLLGIVPKKNPACWLDVTYSVTCPDHLSNGPLPRVLNNGTTSRYIEIIVIRNAPMNTHTLQADCTVRRTRNPLRPGNHFAICACCPIQIKDWFPGRSPFSVPVLWSNPTTPHFHSHRAGFGLRTRSL